MSYIGNENQQIRATRTNFTASGSETSVNVTYTVGQLSVYLNGVKLLEGVDFTASNGTSITGLVALSANDVVDFVSLGDFEVADVVPASGGTFSGAVTVPTPTTASHAATKNYVENYVENPAASVIPTVDATYDLGSATKRWNNIYTTDLHLANERGNWTVIEEENYLTLRNNNTDKVYKLVMEEIE